MHDDGVRYLLSRLVTVDSDIQVAQIPPALLAAQSKTIRPLGLMQCFAVRKNSPEKLAAARQFLKTLASKETQLRLLKAAAINTPQHSYSLRFIPVFRQVRESEEFKQFQAAVPAYKVLMDSRMAAHFTPTDKVLFTQPRDAVLARVSAIEDK